MLMTTSAEVLFAVVRYIAIGETDTELTSVSFFMKMPRALTNFRSFLIFLHLRPKSAHACAIRWPHSKHPKKVAVWAWRRGFYIGIAWTSLVYTILLGVLAHYHLQLP